MAPAGVAITVEGSTRASRDRVFHAIAPVALEEVFTGYGPLPAVVGTHGLEGDWDHVGATRTVELADGSEAREEITSYDAPMHFGYRLSRFTGAMRRLVSGVDGAWWFTESVAGDTQIRWSYTFQPLAGRALLVRATVGPLWRRYAQQTLALAVQRAERPGAAGPPAS